MRRVVVVTIFKGTWHLIQQQAWKDGKKWKRKKELKINDCNTFFATQICQLTSPPIGLFILHVASHKQRWSRLELLLTDVYPRSFFIFFNCFSTNFWLGGIESQFTIHDPVQVQLQEINSRRHFLYISWKNFVNNIFLRHSRRAITYLKRATGRKNCLLMKNRLLL